MIMFASVVTIAMLIALACAGYRLNMYLYTRGALGVHARQMSSLERESHSMRRKHEASLVQVRDYGLHYARTGILLFVILVTTLLLVLVALISSVL